LKGKINYYYYCCYYYIGSDIPFQTQEAWGGKRASDPSCLGVAGAQTQSPLGLATPRDPKLWVRCPDPKLMPSTSGPKALGSDIWTQG